MTVRRLAIVAAILVALWIGAGPLMFSNWHSPIVHKPSDFGLAFEAVEFRSPDQPLTIRAWWLPAPSAKAAIVMVHGGGDNKSHPYTDWLKLAGDLVAQRYSIMDIDLRNHGESDDSATRRIDGGESEANDVIGAIDYIAERGLGSRYGAIGYSLGGQTVLYAAARDKRIEAVVEEGTWSRGLQSILPGFAHAATGLPEFLFVGPFTWSTEHLHGVPLGHGRAVEIIATISPRPVSLIHSEADPIIPADHCRRLSAAYPAAEVWIDPAPSAESPFAEPPWGTHAHEYQIHPTEFVKRVTKFFDAVFAPAS